MTRKIKDIKIGEEFYMDDGTYIMTNLKEYNKRMVVQIFGLNKGNYYFINNNQEVEVER